jgi:hypothetical protein
MSRAVVVLAFKSDRERVKRWVDQAPVNSRVELKSPVRSLPQNDRMWAMLTDIARQAEWAGKKRSTKVWKDLFTAAVLTASNGLEVVPGLDGGIMLIGLRTSEMTVEEMADLITYMEAWGAQNGVTFSDPKDAARDPEEPKKPSGLAA